MKWSSTSSAGTREAVAPPLGCAATPTTAKRLREREARVAQERVGELGAGGELALLLGALRADPGDGRAQALELGEQVAEAAGLRGAAARAGDGVPAGQRLLAGDAGARVDEDDGEVGCEVGD